MPCRQGIVLWKLTFIKLIWIFFDPSQLTPSCRLGNKQKSSWVIPIITHLRFIKLTTQSHSDGFGICPSGPRSANGNNYNYQCENSDEAPAALGGSLSTLFRAIKFRRTLNTAIITWEQFREEGENIKSTSANIHVHIHPSDFWNIILRFRWSCLWFPSTWFSVLLYLVSPSGQWLSDCGLRFSCPVICIVMSPGLGRVPREGSKQMVSSHH